MNNPLSKEDIDSLTLSVEERGEMRANLLAHMHANPFGPMPSPYWSLLSPLRGRLQHVAYACAIVLMLGTGTTFAAEAALPGDVLYGVKVTVVEPLHSALLRTPEEKAMFAVELADRRLADAEIAASEKAADSDTGHRATLAAEHAEAVIAELSASNPEAAEAARALLTATLDAHRTTVASLAAAGEDTNTALFKETVARTSVNAASALTIEENSEEMARGKQEGEETMTLSATAMATTSAEADAQTGNTPRETDSAPADPSLPLPVPGL